MILGWQGARPLILIPILALLACSEAQVAPDVLLVSIDTLRADRVGAYGADRDTTPTLDRLAAEGARFDLVVAPTSWTLPSHASMLTGMPIQAHRVRRIRDRLDPQRRTVTQQLREAGYHTAAFVSAPFLHEAYGFDRGFQVYENFGVGGSASDMPSRQDHLSSHLDRSADAVIDAAIAWLEQTPERPRFLFVHLWDPHYDYLPPAGYIERFDPDYSGQLDASDFEHNPAISKDMDPRDLEHLRALYDADIRWTDDQLGRLIEHLRASGDLDRTIVSVTSDHGEEFFEHGNKGHDGTLFDEVLRVPWLLRYPKQIAAGTSVQSVTGLVDVSPTLLELAGIEPLADASGISRVLELHGGARRHERPVLLFIEKTQGIRGRTWKLLRRSDGQTFYYDLERDPGEQAPETAAPSREKMALLTERLKRERSLARQLQWSDSEPVELDPGTLERLGELGYLEPEAE